MKVNEYLKGDTAGKKSLEKHGKSWSAWKDKKDKFSAKRKALELLKK